MLSFRKAAVLGATGPTGIHLVHRLQGRLPEIRVVSRSAQNLEQAFPGSGVERFPADVLDDGATLRAVQGCEIVFDCIGLPSQLMNLHAKVAENVAAAVKKSGARCVQISSYWPYLPIVRLPLDETHPRQGGPLWAQYRRAAEDILQSAGAAVLNLPDFYGPKVHTSILQNALTDAVRGKSMRWIGGRDVPREHVYVPDAVTIAASLAQREEAYGERWIVPGAGPLTGADLARIVSARLGREAKLRTAGSFVLHSVALFNGELRRLLPMVPHYMQPISFNASKLEALLRKPAITPYEHGIAETLDWLRQESA